MTAQAQNEECVAAPSSPFNPAQLPLPLSPFKVMTPTKSTPFEPLQLSPWCNQSRPTHPPSPPFRRRTYNNNNNNKPRSASCSTPPSHPKPHQQQQQQQMQWRSPSSVLNPSASEFVPKVYKPKPVHNPLGGKLVLVAAGFFERAYGLNGQPRVDHNILKEEMMAVTGCSERAVQAVLYGSSYNDLLEGLRAKVVGYTVQKDMNQDFTLLPFYNFDGNTSASTEKPATSEKPSTKYSALALLALAAFTAVLC